jgi:ubiquinone/menaquinone biosynthesis C-methylase UbiE
LTDSLSFDPMARFYDESRIVEPGQLESALDFLARRFPPASFPNLFEPGIGTGRIAIPLARRGYAVTGVDISGSMLMVLRQRLQGEQPTMEVSFQKASVTDLPFEDSRFDLAVAVHLFYFIKNWIRAADEILRVVRGKGPVILMHTGFGTEVPALNDRYKELCLELGCRIEAAGVSTTSAVVDYYRSRGCEVEWVRGKWCWVHRQSVIASLNYLKQRAFSFTLKTPEKTHREVMKRLENEVYERFGGPSKIIEVPNSIYFAIITR